MGKCCYILLFFSLGFAQAQTALYNQGNIRIHEGGKIGFHTDLINDAPFDQNRGITGFYGNSNLSVSGTVVPEFYDVEVFTRNGLELQLGVDNTNNTNFVVGDIRTPRSNATVYYNFLENGFYTGEGDFLKIDGYAAITNKAQFIFPVGDSEQLRPLVLNSQDVNLFAKCAYFYESPASQSTFSGNFDTFQLDRDLEYVSNKEFWHLEGNIPSTINLSWNSRSDLAVLTDDITTIVPVGWSKESQKWVNLKSTGTLGTLEEGFVVSETFVPNEYEIITFGVSKIPYEPLSKEILSLENYFVSPNGDGINDNFYIPELVEESPNNIVRIFDRFGLKVFEKSNYIDEFNGFSNIDNFVISREEGLPVGVYFYTIYMADLDLNYQGFLYLAR